MDERVIVASGTTTRRFVYDPDGRVIGEYGTSATNVIAERIWMTPEVSDGGAFGGDDGTGGYAPIAIVIGTTLRWVHGNHLGVPATYTSNTGAAIATPAYTLPGFPGQFMTMADLYYNKYRDYDTSTGRYIQGDPIGLNGDVNPYLYALGNPVRFSDPLGLRNVNWFGPWDDASWRDAANKAPSAKGICRIFAHGSRDNIISGYGWDTEYLRSKSSDMVDLANQVTKLCPDEDIIELWSCNTGEGEKNIATELARRSGRPVRAPDKLIWHKGDEIRTTPRDRAGNPGNWREFSPDGGSQVIPNPKL